MHDSGQGAQAHRESCDRAQRTALVRPKHSYECLVSSILAAKGRCTAMRQQAHGA
jgi:hypothetical protein